MKKIMNPYVRELLERKELLIRYIYDSMGYKAGVVVAYKDDKNIVRVGASVVHPEDYLRAFNMDFLKIPAVREFIEDNAEAGKALTSFWKKLANKDINMILFEYPNFDRDKGISQAIKNAKNPQWKVLRLFVEIQMLRMANRAERYFGQEAVLEYRR